MKSIAVQSVAIAAVLAVGSSSVAGRQAHSHPAQPPAPAKPGAAADPQKPNPKGAKPNRPKPENQPGAVMDAAKLAASHADHHEMEVLEGGGVLPEGWRHRFDLPSMKLEHLRFLKDGTSLHITSGPPGIVYDPSITAAGQYVVRGTFSQLAKGEHREGYGPFIGGADLDGEEQRYIYFLVRQDGRFLVKQRTGVNTRGMVDWTPHKAIKSFGTGGAMTNELAIAVEQDGIRFLINGTEVARTPREGVETDGIVGLRVNHQLDLRVNDLTIER